MSDFSAPLWLDLRLVEEDTEDAAESVGAMDLGVDTDESDEEDDSDDDQSPSEGSSHPTKTRRTH